jgi:hypothetical protein
VTTYGVIAIVGQQFTHCKKGLTLAWAATNSPVAALVLIG